MQLVKSLLQLHRAISVVVMLGDLVYKIKPNCYCCKLHFMDAFDQGKHIPSHKGRAVMMKLNYKHLHYFWVIAKSGGVAKAGELLHVTPQSISTQMRQLEATIGDTLWRRAGRKLELTETGNLVFDYADRMFGIGEELQEALRERPGVGHTTLRIGIADVVAKTVAHKLIVPALAVTTPPRLICREGRFIDLLAQLAVHRLDMVISDRAMQASMNVRGSNHLLIEGGVSFLAAPELAARLISRFPKSLDRAPFMLPGEDAAVRPRLMQWFDARGVRPRVVAEFDDTALLKAFGQAGAGVFALPSHIAEQVANQLRLEIIGETETVIEQIYAVTSERRIKHLSVEAIVRTAKAGLA